MSSIVPFKNASSLPSFLTADEVDNTEFTHGAGEGFGVISFRGKVWRLKHKGEEHILTKDGEPITRLNLVLLRANKQYSKIFYAKKYVEGDDERPDCFSMNGITPDASVENPQCETCELCPNNVWGSRITDEGKKGKACQDSRRMAVLLADPKLDITTDEPVLLRVPPASLTDLKTFADGLAKVGIPLWKIITQVSFDTNASFPKMQFKAFGYDEQAVSTWKELREGDNVKRILDTHEDVASAEKPIASKPARAATVTVGDEAGDEGEEDDETPTPEPTPAPTPAPAPAARRGRPAGSKTTAAPAATKTAAAAPAPKAAAPAAKAALAPDLGVEDVDEGDVDSLVNKLLGVGVDD